MNKKFIKNTGLFIAIATIFASCDVSNYSNESNCPVVIGVPTTAVTGPVEAAVNEEISLNVSYRSRSECSDFSAFHKQNLANQRIITANVVYDACSCNDSLIKVKTEIFKFKEAAPGVYELKFKKENDGFVNHTVTVGNVTTN